jgi:NAD(P)-dependent dehydrogenase (short-subunit alcohol dehydrogenase family)
MSGRLQDRIAIVTGAGCIGPGWGNGRAIAVRFAEEGAKIFAVDRDLASVEETVQRVQAAGGEIAVQQCDVTDGALLKAMVDACIARFGRIDVLVNNAGTGAWDDPLASTDAQLEGLLAVNLLAPLRAVRAAVPHMPRGGVIVNVGSVVGELPARGLYGVSKVAVRALSEGLRPELGLRGIAVVLVEPGFIRTEMTARVPLPMPGPEVVARAIAAAAERPRRRTIIVPWYYAPLVWAARLAPASVWERVYRLRLRLRRRRRGNVSRRGISA